MNDRQDTSFQTPATEQNQSAHRANPSIDLFKYISSHEIFVMFLSTLFQFHLSRKALITIFTSLELLISTLKELLLHFLSKNIDNFENTEISELIETYFVNVIYNLNKYSTTYFMRKEFNQNHRYVAPLPQMIGGRWDKRYDIDTGKYVEEFKICEFFYVLIKKSPKCAPID